MNDHVFVTHRSMSVTSDGDDMDEPDTVAYTLRLDSVTLDDEGVYRCQVPAQPSLVQPHQVVVNGLSAQYPVSRSLTGLLFLV